MINNCVALCIRLCWSLCLCGLSVTLNWRSFLVIQLNVVRAEALHSGPLRIQVWFEIAFIKSVMELIVTDALMVLCRIFLV